jgi:prefoldin subunit 5
MSTGYEVALTEADEEVREYVERLQERAELLTERLSTVEEEIDQLQAGEDTVVVDLDEESPETRLVRRSNYLTGEHNPDEAAVASLREGLADVFEERIDSRQHRHEVAYALLWALLHPDNSR